MRKHQRQVNEARWQGSVPILPNTSTIRGQNLPITEEIDIAAKAGYTGIEPWLGKLNEYKNDGGSLKDLRKRIDDHGLTIESAIGFARWIVDDDAQRAKGLEEAKRDMDLLAQLGAKRIAARRRVPVARRSDGGRRTLPRVAGNRRRDWRRTANRDVGWQQIDRPRTI